MRTGLTDHGSLRSDCPANVAPKSVAQYGITNLAGPQAVSIIDNIEQYGHQVSEDCLTLNVWTQPQTGEAKKAVMVWIYGGGEIVGVLSDENRADGA